MPSTRCSYPPSRFVHIHFKVRFYDLVLRFQGLGIFHFKVQGLELRVYSGFGVQGLILGFRVLGLLGFAGSGFRVETICSV